MKHIFLFLIILLSSQLAEAQQKFTDSLFKVQKPITRNYADKENEKLIVDLYQPENSQKDRPLIIFMHGGGFAGGSPRNPQEVKFANIAAAKEYTVGLISYSLKRQGIKTGFSCNYAASEKPETFKMAAEDFKDAVKFIKTNADKFQIDAEKIIVGGSSAGAEAVLNAVYNPDLMFPNSSKYADIKFSEVISLTGALVDSRYLGEDELVPGIFFHGTKDNLVPFTNSPHHFCDSNKPGYLMLDGSKTIVDRLKELDASYLFYSFDGAGYEISGMPFKYLPHELNFLSEVVFENTKIQSHIYK
ncbi:alpha/beta hydrolase [Christiangramia portivictoriae]|uniref:alpha/beta hydrolase fold domain-containing protein n=1 Tax=Christiangramia portivictoriae TaxID=326069 RepID=UPI0003F52BEA|nr:alpha/beta hydrolase [Christiangramia portivictoriae]